MLGSLIVYLKGMRIMMLQLSGYYYRAEQLASGMGFSLSFGFGDLGLGLGRCGSLFSHRDP